MNNEADYTILIIDDDDVVRPAIASYLTEQDYRLVLASDASTGIDCFHSSCPDLVVCNLNLANNEGFETLKGIFSASQEQPIVVLADAGHSHDVIEAMRLGVSDYLIKPIEDMSMLGLSIKNSLRRAKLKEEHRNYEKKLEVANRALEDRIEVYRVDQQAGRHVQTSLLPDPPQNICSYSFNHRVLPSLFLSGDSVDYKPISKNRVLFYLADVSGHGSSSAFISILLGFRLEQLRREYIRSRFMSDFSPASILQALNKDLLDTGLDKHITLFLGILDSTSNSLTYSVAGHYPLPIIYENGEASFINLSKSSFPLGLLSEASYFNESISLEKDFTLTLFSDGILEILDQASLEEKEHYLLKTVVESGGDFGRIKTCLRLDSESLSNLPDDITALSVKGNI